MEDILHQLKTVVYPVIYRVSTIQGDAGFRNHPQYLNFIIQWLGWGDKRNELEVPIFQTNIHRLMGSRLELRIEFPKHLINR